MPGKHFCCILVFETHFQILQFKKTKTDLFWKLEISLLEELSVRNRTEINDVMCQWIFFFFFFFFFFQSNLTYEPATSILTHSQTRDLSNLVFFDSETENLKIYQFSSYSSKSNRCLVDFWCFIYWRNKLLCFQTWLITQDVFLPLLLSSIRDVRGNETNR